MYVGYDQTGSVNEVQLKQFVEFTQVNILPELTGGDVLIIGEITDVSFEYRPTIREFPRSDLYYDRVHEARLDSLRQAISDELGALRPGRAQRSDVYGQLALAGRLLACRDSTWSKYLFVFSDMDDNVSQDAVVRMPDLTGVRVYVIGMSHRFGPKRGVNAFTEKVGYWQTAFHRDAHTANTFTWDWNEAQLNVERIRQSLQQGRADEY